MELKTGDGLFRSARVLAGETVPDDVRRVAVPAEVRARTQANLCTRQRDQYGDTFGKAIDLSTILSGLR